MYTAGIDPGKKGGLAMLRDGELVNLQRMPLCPKDPTGLDLRALCGWVRDWRLVAADYHEPIAFWLEHAQAMPTDARSSAFKYGAGWGALIGFTLSETGSLPHLVRPATWKRAMLGKGKHDKADSVDLALKLYPKADLTPGRLRVPHDGMAEAILIAEYGARKTAE